VYEIKGKNNTERVKIGKLKIGVTFKTLKQKNQQ
jgi:hypothetical protein